MDYLSVSQINTYLRCPAEYYFRYVERIPLPPSPAVTRGRSVHAGIAHNFQEKASSGHDCPLEEILSVTSDFFDLQAETTNWGEESRDRCKDTALALVDLYHTTIAPTIEPALIEERVKIPIPGCRLPLLGFIDLVDSHMIIHDIKTANRRPSTDGIEENLQLTAYAAAFRHLTGIEETGAQLDYLINLKTPVSATLATQISDRQIQRFYRLTAAVAEAIDEGAYFPNPSHYLCSQKFCGYWNNCHDKY